MEDNRAYWKVAVSLTFSLLATVAVLILGYYGIMLFLPFVLGWMLAGISNPLTKWLEKKLKIKRKIGSAIVVILVLAIVVGILYLVISTLITEGWKLIQDVPQLYADVLKSLGEIREIWDGIAIKMPESMRNATASVGTAVEGAIRSFVDSISAPTIDAAGRVAKSVPSIVISVVFMFLSAYFFIADRDEIGAWMRKVTPKAIYKRISMVMDNMKYAVGGYFKAQFQIMGIVFVIVFVGLLIAKVRYAVIIAFLIALLDFFPLFGTGTALIPWLVYEIITGDYVRAIILLITYAVSQIVRQLVQPKVLGDSVGLKPMPTLVFIFLGYQFGGIFGMIFAVPIGLIIINMYKAGAFDYILDDIKILIKGIMLLRKK